MSASVDELRAFASIEAIEGAVRWFDKQRGAGPGLLVHRIRAGGVDTLQPKQQEMRERFARYADRWPEGSTIEPHARLQARRYPEDDPCPGRFVVFEALYPSLIAECDACGFEVGYPLRALNTIPWEKAF